MRPRIRLQNLSRPVIIWLEWTKLFYLTLIDFAGKLTIERFNQLPKKQWSLELAIKVYEKASNLLRAHPKSKLAVVEMTKYF